MSYCGQCLEKQRKIDELQEEIVLLKAKLRYQDRTVKEGFFGSSTPSSKIPVKANSSTECGSNNGGGKLGHIQKIQDIFREKPDRLYHWADDRNIPADNNLAERELRPLVVARKISFGSQSEDGARTRETLMTVLHTLRKRTADVMTAFKAMLDKIAEKSDCDPAELLSSFNSS